LTIFAVIVTGALSKDDEIWDNSGDAEGQEDPNTSKGDNVNWEELCKKWKVTLVDFGFARALSPKDVQKPTLEMRRENLAASYHPNAVNSTDIDKSGRPNKDMSSSKSRRSLVGSLHGRMSLFKMSDDGLNRSTSHLLVRQMSALGNRNFAAPEIINKVKHDKKRGEQAKLNDAEPNDLTETISEYVADYGLMVDAYSMGFTIRYMMTGVPPYKSIAEAIQEQESLCNKLCGGKKNNARRSVRYRRLEELPGEVQRLIENLTERSESKRTSIRTARRSYPWISDVLSGTENELEEQKHSLGEISYLSFTVKENQEENKKEEEKETKAVD
jgi:serine/threonine protein kinase